MGTGNKSEKQKKGPWNVGERKLGCMRLEEEAEKGEGTQGKKGVGESRRHSGERASVGSSILRAFIHQLSRGVLSALLIGWQQGRGH